MKIYFIAFSLLFFLFMPSSSFAINTAELPGEYTLIGFTVDYNGQIITESQVTSFSGRLSMTQKGFVMDMALSGAGGYAESYTCGFYNAYSWSDTINVSIRGGTSETLTASFSNGILTVSGYDYLNGVRSWFEYKFQKEESYYTSSGYSQEQLDKAVADAETVKDAVIEQKNEVIDQKDETIASMYTQEQLDQAVTNAEAAKDSIIANKNRIISTLSDIDGDGEMEMKDIIWGLKILSSE